MAAIESNVAHVVCIQVAIPWAHQETAGENEFLYLGRQPTKLVSNARDVVLDLFLLK